MAKRAPPSEISQMTHVTGGASGPKLTLAARRAGRRKVLRFSGARSNITASAIWSEATAVVLKDLLCSLHTCDESSCELLCSVSYIARTSSPYKDPANLLCTIPRVPASEVM